MAVLHIVLRNDAIVCYEALFQKIHSDLKSGRRKMIEYHPLDLSEGKFYVLRGVLVFLEKSEDELQEFVFESGSRMRFDGRTRCIFDNGTESDMLFRSLDKALQKDGFGISEIIEENNAVPEITEEDSQNGFIYEFCVSQHGWRTIDRW